MMDRIEEVARAIADAGTGFIWGDVPESNCDELDMGDMRRLAQAASAIFERDIAELLGAINEARVHLSDLTDKGLGSVDSADAVLRALSQEKSK